MFAQAIAGPRCQFCSESDGRSAGMYRLANNKMTNKKKKKKERWKETISIRVNFSTWDLFWANMAVNGRDGYYPTKNTYKCVITGKALALFADKGCLAVLLFAESLQLLHRLATRKIVPRQWKRHFVNEA